MVIPDWVDAETAADAAGPIAALSAAVAALDPLARAVGGAVTALATRDDNGVVHQVLAGAPHQGTVLVVAGASSSTRAIIGDITAHQLIQAGIIALVTDGPVRDAATLREMGFPVWCGGITMVAGNKAHPGHIGIPVSIGGVTVVPGDTVIATGSGVVVWAQDRLPELVKAAQAKHDLDVRRLETLQAMPTP